MVKTDNRLSRCKLCGGQAYIAKVEENDGQCHYDNWHVGCKTCGCHFTYAADGYYGRDWVSEEEAIAKWNEIHKRTVYIVTSGCYSDYHIDAVFTNWAAATGYASLDSDRQVEEYEADAVRIETARIRMSIYYSFRANMIKKIDYELYPYSEKQDHIDKPLQVFVFYRELESRVMRDVQEHGKESKMLLRIAQDEWARYVAEHEVYMEEPDPVVTISPEEGAKAFMQFAALHNQKGLTKEADMRVSDAVNKMVKNGETPPEPAVLQGMYHEAVAEIQKEWGMSSSQ